MPTNFCIIMYHNFFNLQKFSDIIYIDRFIVQKTLKGGIIMDPEKIKKLNENSRKAGELFAQVEAENIKESFKPGNHDSWERCFKPLIKIELLMNESEAILDELEAENATSED